MDNITADIIDYLGKYESGVLVLLNLRYKDEFSEGTFYYSDKMFALTVDENLEAKIGCKVESWHGYRDLVISILKKVVPYDEIINRLDEVDFSQYFVDNESTETQAEDIDESDIDIQN